jgi:hypothetical protein
MMLMTGSSPLSASQPTPSPSHSDTRVMSGAKPKNAMTAIAAPAMPAANMLTSISKPALILPSQRASIFFMTHAESGPTIIAPRNIGMVLPVIMPTATIDATTAPRSP